MKAVISLWKKPIDDGKLLYGYNNIKELAESYVLAIELARKQFNEVHLVTDNSGRALLSTQLGIPFDSIDVNLLNQVVNTTPYAWLLPQIAALSVHSEDVVYIEGNTFVFGDILAPFVNERYDVIFQNREPNTIFNTYYVPQITRFNSAPFKPEMMDRFPDKQAYNTSFIYGNNTGLLKLWADSAYDYITNPLNSNHWTSIVNADINHNMIYTNWFAANSIVAMGQTVDPRVGVLFEGYTQNPRVPYIHTHGESRKSPQVVSGIRAKITELFPQYLPRLNELG
ncbi:MAG: hypothetical protein MUC87_20425 [Bacteroidia bacterium]|jgi:hypothetical protein|nr:hypothetical protein [Bacteroidia bacterium]